MKIELDKFVGRNQLPSDQVAFDRISRAFAPRTPASPAVARKADARATAPAYLTAPARKAA